MEKKISARLSVTPVNTDELSRASTPEKITSSTLRPVRSQPDMGTRMTQSSTADATTASLDRLTGGPGSSLSGSSVHSSQGRLPGAGSRAAVMPSRSASVSSGRLTGNTTRGQRASPVETPTGQQRQSSPQSQQPLAASSPQDDQDEEEGGHDTITSLAGAKILQKYRLALPGSRGGSATNLTATGTAGNNLMNLFKDDGLEDIREGDDDDEDDELKQQLIDEGPDDGPDDEDVFVPPDGGYGWFVALGAFLGLFWCAGFIKSYGVIFSQILAAFPESSVSLASWIPASMTSVALAMAPFASALCQRFNCR
jgi:hypothetical protein